MIKEKDFRKKKKKKDHILLIIFNAIEFFSKKTKRRYNINKIPCFNNDKKNYYTSNSIKLKN